MSSELVDDGIFFKYVMPFTVKAVTDTSTGEMYCEGVASSTTVDRQTERISKAALEKGARDLIKNSTVFFNHKHNELGVGKVIESRAEGDKLYIKFIPSKAKGVEDIVTQIKEGVLKCLSIGGKVKDYDNVYDESLKKDVKLIKELELLEVSVVGIGANPDASITHSISKAFTDFEKARFATGENDEAAIREPRSGQYGNTKQSVTLNQTKWPGGDTAAQNRAAVVSPVTNPVRGKVMEFKDLVDLAEEIAKVYGIDVSKRGVSQ